jgi:hypothetical protein
MKSITIIVEAKETLVQLSNVIQELTFDEYLEKIPLLSNATIGEHTRHIIELFQQLVAGYCLGVINYDDRQRDLRLQTDIDFALESIATIISYLSKSDKDLTIISIYNNQSKSIRTNYFRELLFNIEHCIHHQAIIKIGLIYLNKGNVSANFGIAKSTIAYKKQCVQ